jgi:hypothetical protein
MWVVLWAEGEPVGQVEQVEMVGQGQTARPVVGQQEGRISARRRQGKSAPGCGYFDDSMGNA